MKVNSTITNLAYFFCAQCNEIICEHCKTTIHIEHSNKGVFFEYLEFINLANARIHSYKDKFSQYCDGMSLPLEGDYNSSVEECIVAIDKQYEDQKKKIHDQFDYLMKLIIDLRDLEILHLTRFKDHCKEMYLNLKSNFQQLKEDINYGNKVK